MEEEISKVNVKIGYDMGEADKQLEELFEKSEKLVALMKEANSLADELASKAWELPLSIVFNDCIRGELELAERTDV